MRKFAGIALLWSLALLWGCSHTELVPVPPRIDLRTYGTLGIVEFASNADAAVNIHAVFVGDIVYSDPKTDVKITDLTKLDGSVHTEIRGDISSSLTETRTGASVWSSSAWARRQIGRLSISAEQGVSGAMNNENPRDEMVPALVYHLTQDFRPTSVRQRVK